MNITLQTILVFTALTLAVLFLVRKFVWHPKKKTGKACSNDHCGCN